MELEKALKRAEQEKLAAAQANKKALAVKEAQVEQLNSRLRKTNQKVTALQGELLKQQQKIDSLSDRFEGHSHDVHIPDAVICNGSGYVRSHSGGTGKPRQ
jgi:predicted nuclease with TOPRIM domain